MNRVSYIAAAAACTVGLAAANAGAQVLVEGDFDTSTPNISSYPGATPNQGATGSGAVVEGVGVDGTAAYQFNYNTTNVTGFQGFGNGFRTFTDLTPSNVANLLYSMDVQVEGATTADYTVRAIFSGGSSTQNVEVRVPVTYDAELGGFQNFSGDLLADEDAFFRVGTLADLQANAGSYGIISLVFADDLNLTGSQFGLDNDNVITIDNVLLAAAVPEPTSLALLGLGGLTILRRRR